MIEKILNAGLTVGKLAKIFGIMLPPDADSKVKCGRLLTQSVYVNPGDVVISAGWYPRQKTVEEALERGAAAVFCDLETKKKFPQPNVIGVDNPGECVRKYERWRVRFCRAKRIAITGSVGKTTTTGLINAVVANSFKTLTHHTMANSHGAVLRNVQVLNPTHKYWVQEVGGVQPGYVEDTAAFLCPDIVVLTNIGESHLNLYGTKENILKDKASLERYAKPNGVVIVNGDDEMLRTAAFSHRVITCSLQDPNADYYADDISMKMDGIHFAITCKEGKYRAHLNLYGDYNAYNALFAVAVGRLAGVSMPRILELLETYRPSGMRQNLIQVGGYSLFVDSFNAEPRTVLGSARTLAKMPVCGGGRRIFVTGHIDKLGRESPEMHAQLGRELAKLELDQVVLFAGDSKYTFKAMLESGSQNVCLMESRTDLDRWLQSNITREDVVFFKSGQFEAALAKSVDHVFGTSLQNEQQYNAGNVVESNGYRIRIRQDHVAEIEGYVGPETELVLPSEYENNTIVRIAPCAFTGNRSLTSVILPDTIVNIGKEAFRACTRLKHVKLPEGLRIVGEKAFNCCTVLENVKIPEGTIHVDRNAFSGCRSLKTAVIPESVGFLGENAFEAGRLGKNGRIKIICSSHSCAGKYARENDIPVIPIDEYLRERV